MQLVCGFYILWTVHRDILA